jgi:hypothetical protein
MIFCFPGCYKTVNSNIYFSERITESYMRSRWLPSFENGRTSREQILVNLGQPSGTFENGRIYTYRLIINQWKEALSDSLFLKYYNASNFAGHEILESAAASRFEQIEKDGALLIVTDENMEKYEKEIISSICEFHLVLVFTADGILNRDYLIRIRP